jgi:hypothetical protein
MIFDYLNIIKLPNNAQLKRNFPFYMTNYSYHTGNVEVQTCNTS